MRNRICKISKNTIPVLLAATCFACQENVIHRFCAVEAQDWQQKYKARFHITDIKQTHVYQLTAEARIDKQYDFQDLWLVVETRNTNGESIADTICIETVKENGNLDGTGRNILEYQKDVRTLQLKETDTLDICIKHIMQAHPLVGVHDVGIKLEPKN